MTERQDTTTGWIWRDVKRAFWLGVCLGVPLGVAALPFVLWTLGVAMEFRR